MTKEEFILLLQNAKQDEYGNWYVERQEFDKSFDGFEYMEDLKKTRNYFCLVETVCQNFADEYVDNEDGIYYNRHFTRNDDTLEITLVKENK